MYRIILMVVRLFYKVPYYLMRIWWLGTRKNFNLEENYAFIKKVTKAANRAGRVKIESYGLENIPKENGFIFSRIIRECLMHLFFWNPVRFLFLWYIKRKSVT